MQCTGIFETRQFMELGLAEDSISRKPNGMASQHQSLGLLYLETAPAVS
jgi:hypothetical protein